MTMAQIRTDLQLRAAVDTDLECYDKPPGRIETPGFYVGLPDDVDYVHAYGPSGGKATFRCYVVVAPVDADEAVAQLDLYLDPDRGGKAMKVLLENMSVSNTSSMAITEVIRAETVVVTFGTVDYLAAEFEVKVWT